MLRLELIHFEFLDDIETDCIFEKDGNLYIVESKMYKLNRTNERLRTKIRGHYGKLLIDVERLSILPEFEGKHLYPVLLTNISNISFSTELELQLKTENDGFLFTKSRILNAEMLKSGN